MLAAAEQSTFLAVLPIVISVISLVVSLVVAFRSYGQVRYNKRIDLSIGMVAEYFGTEFTIVQRGAWKVRQWAINTPESMHQNARYFCGKDFYEDGKHVVPSERETNELTPLQNVKRFMAFWQRLIVLHEAKLIEPPVIVPLMSQYGLWAEFMRHLSKECIAVSEPDTPASELSKQWLDVCGKLDRLDCTKSVAKGVPFFNP